MKKTQLFSLHYNLKRQSHLILTQPCVMCVCEASASDVSVIVSAYDGIRPQPRGVPTGESSGLSQGDWVLPRRANGFPPAGREATEDPCHPLPLFALPELCQASSGKTHTNTARARTHTLTHTHLELVTWKELSDHRMPPHLRPDLGPKQTKKNKACTHSDDSAGTAPLERDIGWREGERINHRV